MYFLLAAAEILPWLDMSVASRFVRAGRPTPTVTDQILHHKLVLVKKKKKHFTHITTVNSLILTLTKRGKNLKN